MESKLINYDIFIEKRPDMEVHTETSINSCINSAYVLLDGECASLISRVEQFNFNENGIIPDRDTKDILYRTDFELNQLQEAIVFQVQYVLNMGNDFTIGGGSYSIGNVNSSYNRPEGRELIAPGVYKLLSNARVYNLNAFGSFNQKDPNNIPLSTSKEIMERVKNEYVAINQPNANIGTIAYVNQSNQVDFGNPEDLDITTYNTQRIAGPEGYRTNYYSIDNVPNIAFFGPDMDGTFSAVHREEMIKAINDKYGDYFTKEEVLNIVYASGVAWRSDLDYRVDWIVQIVNNKNELLYYQALKDNINKNPLDNANREYWKELTTQQIDLNLIVEQLKPYIDQQLPPLVEEEVKEQLEALPTANYIQETKDQILSFNTIEDYKQFKTINNLSDSDFQDIEKDYLTREETISKLDEKVDLTTTQTITGDKIIENLTINNRLFLGEDKDNPNYYYDNTTGKLLTNTNSFTNPNELVSKEYIENQIIDIKTLSYKGQFSGDNLINRVIFTIPSEDINKIIGPIQIIVYGSRESNYNTVNWSFNSFTNSVFLPTNGASVYCNLGGQTYNMNSLSTSNDDEQGFVNLKFRVQSNGEIYLFKQNDWNSRNSWKTQEIFLVYKTRG